MSIQRASRAFFALALAALAGCGGGGGASGPMAPATYTIGGTVSGLAAGKSVVLQNNGGGDLAAGNGSFTFATALTGGMAYAVTVKTQPNGQECTISSGSGTVGAANVTTVTLACADLPAVVWGTASGGTGSVGTWDHAKWQ